MVSATFLIFTPRGFDFRVHTSSSVHAIKISVALSFTDKETFWSSEPQSLEKSTSTSKFLPEILAVVDKYSLRDFTRHDDLRCSGAFVFQSEDIIAVLLFIVIEAASKDGNYAKGTSKQGNSKVIFTRKV